MFFIRKLAKTSLLKKRSYIKTIFITKTLFFFFKYEIEENN